MEKIKAESLEHARQQIDAIDTALVELIAARQFYVDQTTRFKKTETDLQSPERMEQIVEHVRAENIADMIVETFCFSLFNCFS